MTEVFEGTPVAPELPVLPDAPVLPFGPEAPVAPVDPVMPLLPVLPETPVTPAWYDACVQEQDWAGQASPKTNASAHRFVREQARAKNICMDTCIH